MSGGVLVESPQNRDQLRGIVGLLTQRSRPLVGSLDFRRTPSAGSEQCGAQRELKREFLPGMIECFGQGVKQVYRSVKMSDGFCVCRALYGLPSRQSQKLNGLGGIAATAVMTREVFVMIGHVGGV